MIVRLVVFLVVSSNLCQGCSLIMADLRTELKGQGYHRTLHLTLDISSLKRLIDCRVSYHFRIPKGAYVDTDPLNISLLNHCFLSTPFNTEVPANHPSLKDHKPIIFQSNTELRKVFVFNDVLEFPIHLRYHEPSDVESGYSDTIIIPPPTIYLHCKSNDTLMVDKSCKENIEKLACGCKSKPKCDFFRLNYRKKPEALKAHVPIGRLWQVQFVTYSTISIVLLLVVWIIWSTVGEECGNTSTDKKGN